MPQITPFHEAIADGLKDAALRPQRRAPGPTAFIETCGECGSDLTDRMKDEQTGAPIYCDHCDRIPDTVGRRDVRPEACARAVRWLKLAREELRAAGAPAAADYVRRALKSAEGAERHAFARRYR